MKSATYIHTPGCQIMLGNDNLLTLHSCNVSIAQEIASSIADSTRQKLVMKSWSYAALKLALRPTLFMPKGLFPFSNHKQDMIS